MEGRGSEVSHQVIEIWSLQYFLKWRFGYELMNSSFPFEIARAFSFELSKLLSCSLLPATAISLPPVLGHLSLSTTFRFHHGF